MARGKKYKKAIGFIEAGKIYDIPEAVELLEKTNTVKFDPTVEIHFNLRIDPKHADQMVRSIITLPNGTGKVVRVAAFTDAGNEKEIMDAWAVMAGNDDLIERISKGESNFDIAIATPDMMKKLGKVARILWPKGLMPNPKAGTVWEDLLAILKEVAGGRFEFKNDKQGNIHSIIGKLSFGSKKLQENLEFFIKAIQNAKPTGVKWWEYILSASICNAMGPSIKIHTSK